MQREQHTAREAADRIVDAKIASRGLQLHRQVCRAIGLGRERECHRRAAGRCDGDVRGDERPAETRRSVRRRCCYRCRRVCRWRKTQSPLKKQEPRAGIAVVGVLAGDEIIGWAAGTSRVRDPCPGDIDARPRRRAGLPARRKGRRGYRQQAFCLLRRRTRTAVSLFGCVILRRREWKCVGQEPPSGYPLAGELAQQGSDRALQALRDRALDRVQDIGRGDVYDVVIEDQVGRVVDHRSAEGRIDRRRGVLAFQVVAVVWIVERRGDMRPIASILVARGAACGNLVRVGIQRERTPGRDDDGYDVTDAVHVQLPA